jgi:hypothetical protein
MNFLEQPGPFHCAVQRKASTGEIRRFVIEVADELRQAGVAQHLADRHVFTGVVPVMVDHSLQQCSLLF